MLGTLEVRDTILFDKHALPNHRTKLGIIGVGAAVRARFWPALLVTPDAFSSIAVCSLENETVLDGLQHRYFPIPSDSLLPLAVLEREGFLSDQTLWIVATPSSSHATYAFQLARWCTVAIEKPIAVDSSQANSLLPLLRRSSIYPIDHKLFAGSAPRAFARLRENPSLLDDVRSVEGTFFEESGFERGRSQEDTIADIQYHLFALMAACSRAAGRRLGVCVDRVQVSAHTPDPQGRFQSPRVWTASRLRGVFFADHEGISYDFKQVKGAPITHKLVRFLDGGGNTVLEVDLNESGWQPHARVLEALRQPSIDTHHTCWDAIKVMNVVDLARSKAVREPDYEFGELPSFTEDE